MAYAAGGEINERRPHRPTLLTVRENICLIKGAPCHCMMKQITGGSTEQYGRVAGSLQKNVCFAGLEAEIVSPYKGKTMPSRTDSTGSRVGTDAALNVPSADQFKSTTCYMCACRCGIEVHLQGRPHPLHRGQPRPPGQPRRAVRQGLRRASCSNIRRRGCASRCCASARAAAASSGRSSGTRRWRSRPSWLGAIRATDPKQARLLHRPRPEPVADRLVGGAVRHAELRRAWRLLLGQHGGGRALHHRRLVLGVRRAGLGAHAAIS